MLDANAVSDAFAGRGRVRARLHAAQPRQIAVPTLVVFELVRGAIAAGFGPTRRQSLDRFLSALPVFAFEEADARHAADVDAALRAAGTPIGPVDTLIAGTARARGLTLVTHNVAEFGRVPGLQLEDWY